MRKKTLSGYNYLKLICNLFFEIRCRCLDGRSGIEVPKVNAERMVDFGPGAIPKGFDSFRNALRLGVCSRDNGMVRCSVDEKSVSFSQTKRAHRIIGRDGVDHDLRGRVHRVA